jgi:5-methyltetrahydropteroyltriglutamate--homocysteine methyltransferase
MTIASNLGFPRIGHRRALKTALESFWSGQIDASALHDAAHAIMQKHWQIQRSAGIGHIPSSDFTLYDHVLDTAMMLGAVPPGYGWKPGEKPSLAQYFALARGTHEVACGHAGHGQAALEMTKWFDTNYHYMVPRLHAGQRFELTENRALTAYRQAASHGLRTRPVLLGPFSFLHLSKTDDGSDALDLLPRLLPLYQQILAELAQEGVSWVQIDEPVLALDLTSRQRDAITLAYAALACPPIEILLASYFAPMGDNLPTILALPVHGLHLDLCRGAADLTPVLDHARPDLALSLGLVDGRNIWRTDLRAALRVAQQVAAQRDARRVLIAPSCSLLHVPLDSALETKLPTVLHQSLAFAVQKLGEIADLAKGVDEGASSIALALEASDRAIAGLRDSEDVHHRAVADRLAGLSQDMAQRRSGYATRRMVQQKQLGLPAFPTTTIGSLPQTAEIRQLRAAHARGEINDQTYDDAIADRIAQAVSWQEEIGIDVLVHGEFERNDMVRYFGEQLAGFAFTQHGWVQSYGSRCVAPPIIWGDVARPAPMTLRWTLYAQSLTKKPMKAMLTGPVTILQWSFVREDVPRETVCKQIALALRDEVADLEAAHIGIIQIDEPALREGLPLRRAEQAAYLVWAVESFRLTASPVADGTQIHTHMCYADFNDILSDIAALDADVISIEATRSRMELLDGFATHHYPNDIGPGVWDIHSPRVPEPDEMLGLLRRALTRIEPGQLWVNPDCGLKTRKWEEVRPALVNMVSAAKLLRREQMA